MSKEEITLLALSGRPSKKKRVLKKSYPVLIIPKKEANQPTKSTKSQISKQVNPPLKKEEET